MMAELVMEGVCYRYPGTKKDIIKDVNASFPAGKVSAIMGRSGAGKSTTLYLLAGLDVPNSGRILYNGEELKRSMLDGYRRNEAATIAQNYLLFPTRTALENVLYPLQLAKTPQEEAISQAKRCLSAVDIPEELYDRLPAKLSGGEQQRVAIARALASNANIIAADEPTGNLDEENADAVMALLKALAHDQGKTVIIVTHDSAVAEAADVVMKLKGGKLQVEYSNNACAVRLHGS